MAAVTQSNGNKLASDDDGPDDRAIAGYTGTEKPGFFTVYKKGQGYHTRLGTALGAALLVVVLALFAYEQTGTFATQSKTVPAVVTAVIVLIGAVVAWRLMNAPRSVDFLISTDSEMKKVNWTSREELIGSTRVVILFLFVIALLLFLIDVGAGAFFQWIGLLKFGILG